jgi:lipooligosaccharide transport system ATP-binding protein
VEPLSGGMKRRLTIARSLVNGPEILLLDEPTTGLDPQARHVLWDRLFRLKRSGVTLVLTTHYMDEAEQLCDRLVVMDGGRIVAEGSPRSLINEYSTREVLELRFQVEEHAPLAARVEGLAERVEVLPDRLLLYTDDGDAATAAVHDRGLNPLSSLVRRSTLEDVFLRLTGRTLVD